MLIYLTSENNQERFNFLKEAYIMNTEVKVKLNQDTFMKCIKKELRNIEIHCLIIDLQIFDKDEIIDFKHTLEAFNLLNPECKVIITYEEDGGLPERLASIKHLQEIHILNSKVGNEEFIDIIEGVERNPAIDDLAESSDPVMEKDAKVEDENEEVIDISEKDLIVAPIKLAEGEPLRKKVKGLPDVSDGDRSSTVKHSARVKKHQNNNALLSSTKVADDHSWSCSNIMIGIVGAERRSGTTAAAMHLVNYLRDQGAVVMYTEANRHEHLVGIAKEYDFIQEEDHFIYKDVTYYSNSQFDQSAGANFVIFDMGSLNEDMQRKEKILNEIMNEIIIVTGCKVYELEALDHAVMTLDNNNITILGNLASEEEIARLQEAYKGRAKTIAANPYEPNLMMPGQWPDRLRELLLTMKCVKQFHN